MKLYMKTESGNQIGYLRHIRYKRGWSHSGKSVFCGFTNHTVYEYIRKISFEGKREHTAGMLFLEYIYSLKVSVSITCLICEENNLTKHYDMLSGRKKP